MTIASYVFFALFALISFFHLFFCFIENDKLRKISKTFCVGSLSIAIGLYAHEYYLIYLGAIFGTIGDLFLIKKKDLKYLICGIIAFFIGHLFYSIQMLMYVNTPIWGYFIYVICVAVLIILSNIVLHSKLSKIQSGATAIGLSYFTMLISMLLLSIIITAISYHNLYLILVILGYAFFVSSDFALLYSHIKPFPRHHFYIMLTYLIAQCLICLGLVFTCLGI